MLLCTSVQAGKPLARTVILSPCPPVKSWRAVFKVNLRQFTQAVLLRG
ncbi:MAG: hypothetical protein KAH96_03270 [Alphaproteobacteria bacterium]|nr:hypothetical protein [Alphaproteobacteria bacterium]